LAYSLLLPVISICARVANPIAKENSAELLTTKDERLAQSTFQLKIDIGRKYRKLAGVILSPVALSLCSHRVFYFRATFPRWVSVSAPGRFGDHGPAYDRNLVFSVACPCFPFALPKIFRSARFPHVSKVKLLTPIKK